MVAMTSIANIETARRRSPGRPKSRADAAERERITAGALELFLASGYGGTTMDAVAARCRVSKRTLYRLFPAKMDLFRAMVADHRRSMLALPRAASDEPLHEQLAAIFRLDIDVEQDRGRMAFVLLAIAEAERFPEIGEALRLEGADASRQMLAAWLAQQQAADLLRPFPPEAAARMLMDMIFSVQIRRFPGDRELDRSERIAHARQCIDLFLNGLAP
jgi:AcrR family transcriptional regulator